MSTKIMQFAQGLCAILIIQLVCISYANTSTQLEQAETSVKNGQLEQVKLNIISLIQQGKYEQAQIQTQKLTADFLGTNT